MALRDVWRDDGGGDSGGAPIMSWPLDIAPYQKTRVHTIAIYLPFPFTFLLGCLSRRALYSRCNRDGYRRADLRAKVRT